MENFHNNMLVLFFLLSLYFPTFFLHVPGFVRNYQEIVLGDKYNQSYLFRKLFCKHQRQSQYPKELFAAAFFWQYLLVILESHASCLCFLAENAVLLCLPADRQLCHMTTVQMTYSTFLTRSTKIIHKRYVCSSIFGNIHLRYW